MATITSSFLDCRVPASQTFGGGNPSPTMWMGPGRPINVDQNNGIIAPIDVDADIDVENNGIIADVDIENNGVFGPVNNGVINTGQNNGVIIGIDGPVQVNIQQTSYIVVFPAADRTRSWMATYTVSASCPDECSAHAHHDDPDFVPPNFVVTTVDCDVCAVRQQVITCPNALGVAPVTVEGDGITATVVVTDAPAVATLPVARPVVEGEAEGDEEEDGALPVIGAPLEDDELEGDDAEGGGDDSFGPVVGTGAAPGRTISSFQPVVTAAAPRAMNLKQGLTFFMGIGIAFGSIVLA
ncbi:hypothetical protein QBC39DRAFT_384002 [Podospora conica]|nr:hypothetical protein QBC39DRAFT_384002 [Schizothecium conicum]